MRVLFLGDLVGSCGREAVISLVPRLRQQHRLDYVVVNGENVAGGRGITAAIAEKLFDAGVDVISGGNFHGQPLALAMDYAKIALAEIASIAERRTYLLLEGHDGLPELLMKETGINSGFMMPQYTAAALVSENKVLCHPASVDSIPSSLGQEDHVSMGSISAVKLLQVFKNVQHVLAIELMTAAQALDFRKPLRPGKGVDLAHRHVRSVIPHVEQDVVYNDYLSLCHNMVTGRNLIRYITGEYGLLN